MPLLVDHVWCKEETDELGSDDVYMVVFRGNTTAPFDSNVAVWGPGDFWDDFDTDDDWSQDIAIAKWRKDAVYLVMLVEEDNNRDISGQAVLGAWKAQTTLAWKAQMLTLLGGGPGPATEAQKQTAATAIRSALQGLSSIYMELPKGNDDLIGAPKRVKIAPGQQPVIDFIGDGGHYKVRFKVAT